LIENETGIIFSVISVFLPSSMGIAISET